MGAHVRSFARHKRRWRAVRTITRMVRTVLLCAR